MLKKVVMFASAALLAVGLAACGGNSDSNNPMSNYKEPSGGFSQLKETPNEGEEVVVITTSMGIVKVRFFPEYAPKAVENFVTHAKNGSYDGVIFHRVIEGFMIQGGDIDHMDGRGGSSIWGEGFGVEPSPQLHHIRGALSMAQSSLPDSIGSQFYIVQNNALSPSDQKWFNNMLKNPDKTYTNTMGQTKTSESGKYYKTKELYQAPVIEAYLENGGVPHLDFGYTVFGQVFEGMDVVDAIAAVEKNGEKPIEDVVIISAVAGIYQADGTVLVDEIPGVDQEEDVQEDVQEEDVQNEEEGEIEMTEIMEQLKANPEKGEEIGVITTNMGVIKVRFFPQYAPKAVENFVTHAKNGKYDSVIFHRVIEGFMIQGGDIDHMNGYGGSSIWGEGFGIEPSPQLHHFRGALAMAQSSAPNSIGSQFYIVQNDGLDSSYKTLFNSMIQNPEQEVRDNYGVARTNEDGKPYTAKELYPKQVVDAYLESGGVPFLDFDYTVFGQVFEGMDVVDAIARVSKGAADKPVNDVVIESMTIEKY